MGKQTNVSLIIFFVLSEIVIDCPGDVLRRQQQ